MLSVGCSVPCEGSPLPESSSLAVEETELKTVVPSAEPVTGAAVEDSPLPESSSPDTVVNAGADERARLLLPSFGLRLEEAMVDALAAMVLVAVDRASLSVTLALVWSVTAVLGTEVGSAVVLAAGPAVMVLAAGSAVVLAAGSAVVVLGSTMEVVAGAEVEASVEAGAEVDGAVVGDSRTSRWSFSGRITTLLAGAQGIIRG